VVSVAVKVWRAESIVRAGEPARRRRFVKRVGAMTWHAETVYGDGPRGGWLVPVRRTVIELSWDEWERLGSRVLRRFEFENDGLLTDDRRTAYVLGYPGFEGMVLCAAMGYGSLPQAAAMAAAQEGFYVFDVVGGCQRFMP
jgi:hypothetical protein